MTKLIVNNKTDAWKRDVNVFFTITNCQITSSSSLTHLINYTFMCLSAYLQWKLVNERARISLVIVKLIIIIKAFTRITIFIIFTNRFNFEYFLQLVNSNELFAQCFTLFFKITEAFNISMRCSEQNNLTLTLENKWHASMNKNNLQIQCY